MTLASVGSPAMRINVDGIQKFSNLHRLTVLIDFVGMLDEDFFAVERFKLSLVVNRLLSTKGKQVVDEKVSPKSFSVPHGSPHTKRNTNSPVQVQRRRRGRQHYRFDHQIGTCDFRSQPAMQSNRMRRAHKNNIVKSGSHSA